MLRSSWHRNAALSLLRCRASPSARRFSDFGNGSGPGWDLDQSTGRVPRDFPADTNRPGQKEYDPCKEVLDMLASGDALSYESNWEQTALKEASETGDVEAVQKLLEENSSVQQLIIQDQWRRTALIEASSKGHVEIAKLLLAADSSTEHLLVQDHEEKTALMEASEKGHVEIVKLLLAANATDEHIYARDNWRCTPLCKASLKGHTDVVEALLDANASEDHLLIQDYSKATALYAASVEGHLEIVKLLLAADASTKHVRSTRKTPPYLWWQAETEERLLLKARESTSLAAAGSAGHIEIVRLLLAAMMKNEVECFQDLRECLSFAAFFGQKEIVQYLLAFASPNIERIALSGKLGGTVLLEVCRRGDATLAKILLEMKPHWLVVFDPKRPGRTALSYACEHGDLESVKLMLEVNSSKKHLYAVDDFSGNALAFACENGHVEVVKTLLKLDSSKEHLLGRREERKVAHSHITPLMLASAEGHVEVVKVLLALRPTPTYLRMRDANYRAALKWAKSGGHQPVIEVLLGEGKT